MVDHGLRAGARLNGVGRRRQRAPQVRMPAWHDGDRRGTDWTRAYRRRTPSRWREAQPRRLAGKTAGVQPGRLVVLDARREDLVFPGARRGREALELSDHRIEARRTLGLVVRG